MWCRIDRSKQIAMMCHVAFQSVVSPSFNLLTNTVKPFLPKIRVALMQVNVQVTSNLVYVQLFFKLQEIQFSCM